MLGCTRPYSWSTCPKSDRWHPFPFSAGDNTKVHLIFPRPGYMWSSARDTLYLSILVATQKRSQAVPGWSEKARSSWKRRQFPWETTLVPAPAAAYSNLADAASRFPTHKALPYRLPPLLLTQKATFLFLASCGHHHIFSLGAAEPTRHPRTRWHPLTGSCTLGFWVHGRAASPSHCL